jgi:multidrug efflux system outer membrane protein
VSRARTRRLAPSLLPPAMLRRLGLGLVLGLVSAGCTVVGPDYERPEVGLPQSLPGEVGQFSLGDRLWFELFEDPALQQLIREGLQANLDIQLAAERVIEARLRITTVDADFYPDLNAAGGLESRRASRNGPVPLAPGVDHDSDVSFLSLDLSWEIDFWGRVARASEAARADLLASAYTRRAVVQSLVTELALAYFRLIELDAELEIAQQTLESRIRSRDLVGLRQEGGVANRVEWLQAESLVLSAAGLKPDLEQRIVFEENLIKILLGDWPGGVPRGRSLREQPREFEIPTGLPSELLARRPDIAIAEQELIAANARIGEARALLYPSISLTGTGGVESDHLSDLFEGDSTVWSLVPAVSLPIFNAGRLQAGVDISESRQRQSALFYLATLQRAFAEVSDALVGYQKTREVHGFRVSAEETLAEQSQLSSARYRGGVTSYLEVLDSERDHFDAELALVQSMRDELLSLVVLYRALGGGWQDAEAWAVDDESADEPEAVDLAGGDDPDA